MEKRVVKKCEEHLSDFKEQIKNWFEEHNITITGNQTTSDFLQFVYDFNNIKLTKDDFAKRKRIKNIVPQNERCCACRANGEQCTRRKQDSLNFCGTHFKGTPHGTIDSFELCQQVTTKKLEVTIKEIKGINYYIDNDYNIYKTEDVLSGKVNPDIIGKYNVDENGIFYLQNL